VAVEFFINQRGENMLRDGDMLYEVPKGILVIAVAVMGLLCLAKYLDPIVQKPVILSTKMDSKIFMREKKDDPVMETVLVKAKEEPKDAVGTLVVKIPVVYVLVKGAYDVKISGKLTAMTFVRSGQSKPFSYQGHKEILLQAEIYDVEQDNKKIVEEPVVETFSGGSWVLVFDDIGVWRTQDLSVLPKPRKRRKPGGFTGRVLRKRNPAHCVLCD